MGERRIDVWYLLPRRTFPGRRQRTVYDCVSGSDSHASQCRESDAAERASLLSLKEIEEINSWARSGFRLFVGVFAWQFSINVVAMVWLYNRGPAPTFSRWLYALFIGWNLLGTIGSLLVQKSFHDGDLRIERVIEGLTRRDENGELAAKPRSAIPMRAINTVVVFFAVAMFASFAFWTISFITRG